MRIVVNGVDRELPEGARVVDLVPSARGHAVAVNGVVVPRAGHDRALAEGDRVEIVTAVQGG